MIKPPKIAEEAAFLRDYDVHAFEVPLTTVDIAIFSVREGHLNVLLVQRAEHPFMGRWALPGGFIDLRRDRTLDGAALRRLKEETGVKTPYLEQLQTFGSAKRDPRGWSVTCVYFALMPSETVELLHGPGTAAAQWWPIQDERVEPSLAFDHAEILEHAVTRLRNKVEYTSLPVHLLPAEFTLTECQHMFEIILGRKVDKSAFRKRVLDAGFMEEIKGRMRLGSNRPAQLYRIKKGETTVFFPRTLMARK
ncbi:MAG TPA: NUDIX domain-containing protein [Burkholderiales bacterium]|nr:NUDIX domain-containing protein [Burkholderiales bacterium]